MKTQEKKVLTASCRYCHKAVYSLSQGQLTHNILVHELTCPMIKTKRDHEKPVEKPKPASDSGSPSLITESTDEY